MGKWGQNEVPLQQYGVVGTGNRVGGGSAILCERCWVVLCRIGAEFNFKCVFILGLSVALFLSAVFWVVPRQSKQSGFDAKQSIKLSATVQAYLRLQKPVSQLIPHIARLEYEIYEEIGVPFMKVALLSMHQAGVSNGTNVVVGILSDPMTVSINPVSLSVLRSSLVELFLEQSNLTLTTSIFGQPSLFQILKFPGGINIIPQQSASFWQIPQILFNFTLNNSISEIKENFLQLKQQLKLGLYLKPYEHVYVQVTNNNGSTQDPPVTVQASVMSDLGNLQPQRLKQLTQTITGSPPAKNLGLNNSVFGKVKEISLSSYLNGTIHGSPSIPSPAPSPVSEPPISPSPFLSPSYSPAPLPDVHIPPCFNCDAYSPSDGGYPSAPNPEHGHPHYLSPIPDSPAPSIVNAPSPLSIHPPPIVPTPQMSPGLSPLPAVSYGSGPNQERGNSEGVSPPFASSSISVPSSCFTTSPPDKEISLQLVESLAERLMVSKASHVNVLELEMLQVQAKKWQAHQFCFLTSDENPGMFFPKGIVPLGHDCLRKGRALVQEDPSQ